MIPSSHERIEIEGSVLEVRAMTTLDEGIELVELQREIWGYGLPNADFPYPARALFALSKSGGHVAVAYENSKPVAFSLAWIGRQTHSGPTYLHSQLLGVLRRYRHRGIGYHLKLVQRDFALQSGIDLIRWTFDPLRSTNANLNIGKLGAVVQLYAPDYYGRIDGQFGRGLASDRVWAEWHVGSPRVDKHVNQPLAAMQHIPSHARVTRVVENSSGYRCLAEYRLELTEQKLLMEIPADFDGLCQVDFRLATRWQQEVRGILQHYLDRGYKVSGFLTLATTPRRVFYVLDHSSLPCLLDAGLA